MVLVALKEGPQAYKRERYYPVRVLWAQVLKRAIFDFVVLRNSKKIKDRRDYQSAKQWLFSPDGGLVDACRVFGWSLQRIRERVQEMTVQDVRKMEFRDRESPSELEAGDGNDQ